MLEGVHQNVVQIDSAACLGQSESCGILVIVTMELFHGEGIDFLPYSIFQILWNECSCKVFIKLSNGFLIGGYVIIGKLQIPSFSEGGSSSDAHLVEHYEYLCFVIIGAPVHNEVGLHATARIHCVASTSFPEKSSGGLAVSSTSSGSS